MIKRIKVLNPLTDEVVKEIPIRISYGVLKNTQTKTKKLLSEAKEDDFDLYEELLWQAYSEGCRVVTEPKEYKREQMEELMDTCYYEFIATIPDFFPKRTPATIANEKK